MRDGAASAITAGLPSVLLIGTNGEEMRQWMLQGYRITSLDIEPRTKPDVLASMTDIGDIGPFDVVFCAHALEHLYPHEVPKAFAEFYRVLNKGGVATVLVPDLQDVRPTEDVLPGLGLCGLSLYYGAAEQIEEFPYMAHHCGFVADTLYRAMAGAGFSTRVQRLENYQLMGVGVRQ